MLADAQPAPIRAPAPHLLLVPADAQAALAATDPRVVASYESFVLVEAAGADEMRLRASGADRRDDMRAVTTAAGAIDPTKRPSLAGKRVPDRDEVLALVQFIGPPKDAWVRRLRATGAHLVTYQPENAYVVHAAGAAVDRLAALMGADPAVRAVTPMTAEDKVEGKAGAAARYAVTTVAGAAGNRARAEASSRGGARVRSAAVGGRRMQRVRLSATDVRELASDPAVVAIEPVGTPEPHDESTSQIVAGNLAAPAFTQPSGPGYLAWHDGKLPGPFDDVTIDVTDSGIDNGAPTTHADFHVDGSGADRLIYARDYGTDANARDCSGHGTNVASIAAGYNQATGPSNEDSGLYNYGLGVAPRASIGASKIFKCDGTNPGITLADLEDVASDASAGGASISNNSWGTRPADWGSYSDSSALYDELVRDAQPGGADQALIEVFSAGNDGDSGSTTISPEASAKNVITVGASEGVRPLGTTNGDGCEFDSEADNAREVAGFSSRGPTDDGRLKPDLVAPGTHVTGARPTHGGYLGNGTCTPVFPSGSTYSIVSGTSQAAPQVSGAAALVYEDYADSHAGTPPSPALTKAILINTATDLVSGPDTDQGWGRVNTGTALDDSSSRNYYDQDAAGGVLTNVADSTVRAFTAPNPSQPVKVTLVWTDPPGATTGNSWVNNLDLKVVAGGRSYLGNVFGGGSSRTGGDPDIRNNVESVYLPGGTSGRFSVTVRATNLPGDGAPGGDATDQDFALVVSNATLAPAPVLAHESTTIGGGDGDSALESDEQVQLTEAVRNSGNVDATGVAATLTGGSGVTVTQGSSTYSDIGDDAVESNAPSFSLHLANAATCGADAQATLSITAASETQSIPLVLPTGEPGAPQTQAAASSPVVIPDNSAAGVSSSVFVAERGRIKDVDVAIPFIDHDFVGDLVIDLTGPDGTRVRLAERPGGPDNPGQDFVGTVFDDQAMTNISAASAPYTGSFKPQNDQLSRFNGTSRRGTWTLTVRDVIAADEGTLQGWSLVTRKALCNVDTAPPDTAVGGGPSGSTTATSAQFSLSSNDGGATFECRLDGAAYEPCASGAAFSGLSLGTHTFNARAIDGSDNEDPSPAAHTWTVTSQPPPPRPTPAASFVLAPLEERLADALAGRYRVLAACAASCRASAKLTVSARTARRLKLGRKAVTLASASRSRRSAGTLAASLPLTKKARAALRGRKLTEATLQVTLTEGAARLTLKRPVQLRQAGGLRRVASRGLRLWAVCARSCPLRGELTISARGARRLGLRPGSARRMEVASGRTTATRTPKVLTLAVRRSVRRALERARQVGALLEAAAGTAPEPVRTAKLSTTLRR